MSYAAQADIEAEFKGIEITTTSAVTITQITEWLAQASAYIDAKVGMRYVTPVTGTISLSILKMICTFLVAERVKNKLEVKSNIKQKDSEEKFIPSSIMTPRADLDNIAKGKLPLPDAIPLSSKLGIGSFTADFAECDPTFDVCKDQW